jgi:hypothetical protein
VCVTYICLPFRNKGIKWTIAITHLNHSYSETRILDRELVVGDFSLEEDCISLSKVLCFSCQGNICVSKDSSLNII